MAEAVSKFFSKEDIEFLKKINDHNNNLENILNQQEVKEADGSIKENVIKEKHK